MLATHPDSQHVHSQLQILTSGSEADPPLNLDFQSPTVQRYLNLEVSLSSSQT